MSAIPALLTSLIACAAAPLAPGDHARSVRVGETSRSYSLHVPPSYDGKTPTPLVLALHPFATNGKTMARLSGLSETADRHGFLVAFPDGTGRAGLLRWDLSATPRGEGGADLRYLVKVLDDIESAANVASKRVYATGFSNGGMMCYVLASELSDRVAAVAAVAGTMPTAVVRAVRPVSILHVHGTKDSFVAYDGRLWREPGVSRLRGVEESVKFWAGFDGCPETPVSEVLPRKVDDGLAVKRLTYGPGRENAEVILYVIEGGGHTWPGRPPLGSFLGATALDLDANERIWAFFEKHPMP